MVANADGSGARALTETQDRLSWWEWSPDGRQIAFTSHVNHRPTIHVVSADGSAPPRAIDVGMFAESVTWRPPDGAELIFRATRAATVSGIFAVRPDGTGLREVTPMDGSAQYGYQGPFSMTSDGSTLTYTVWEGNVILRLHFVDVTTGEDRERIGPMDEAHAVFSPDNKLIAFNRRAASTRNDVPTQVFVGPVDDPAAAVAVGPESTAVSGDPGLAYDFSPDGTKVIVTKYRTEETYVAGVTGGSGEFLAPTADLPNWQRLAP
jgi:dipeptidyl aminopeptidase/acylaminoacyl peptidase